MSPRLKKRPKKSLRTLLMLWLLLFSIVPLAFITGYSLVKYEQAINQELFQRLMANRREFESLLMDYNRYLTGSINKISRNKTLISQLNNNENDLAGQFVQSWMELSRLTHRIALFNREGQLVSTVYRNEEGGVERFNNNESRPIYISEKFIKSMGRKEQTNVIDIRPGSFIDFSAFSKVFTEERVLVGHIEEVVRVDDIFLSELKKRLGLEIVFSKRNIDGVFSSHRGLTRYTSKFFIDKISKDSLSRFDLNIRGAPFSFLIWPMNWGDDQILISLGVSKRSVQEVLKNIKYAFFTVIGTIIILLIGLSFIISRMLLKPLLDLVEVIQTMDPDKELVQLPVSSDSEMGLLTESFNNMFKRVHQSQNQLKGSIGELEKANAEIREAQSQFVHTAKMASLGQLVAGVAHELNNPIGFIHSNMGSLRDYSEKLINIIKASEKKTKKGLEEIKKENEFDYIVKDMPKLIKSCEEGTRRTREIVLGLRNFSRLEEARLKEVDIHEGIKNTLNLLGGELKNRIEVKKKFGKIPLVHCYPSELNQVFMNVLSNAAQAIEGEGTIEIKTKKAKNKVEVVIKDSGEGIPSELIEKIFDPFFTTKELGIGTGLGLSISYGIMRKYGGEILVHSQVGRGTRVTLIVPIEGPPESLP